MASRTPFLAAFVLLWGAVGPAHAQQIAAGVSCDYVRAMSEGEREAWIKRLALTPEQVARIKKRCGRK